MNGKEHGFIRLPQPGQPEPAWIKARDVTALIESPAGGQHDEGCDGDGAEGCRCALVRETIVRYGADGQLAAARSADELMAETAAVLSAEASRNDRAHDVLALARGVNEAIRHLQLGRPATAMAALLGVADVAERFDGEGALPRAVESARQGRLFDAPA